MFFAENIPGFGVFMTFLCYGYAYGIVVVLYMHVLCIRVASKGAKNEQKICMKKPKTVRHHILGIS